MSIPTFDGLYYALCNESHHKCTAFMLPCNVKIKLIASPITNGWAKNAIRPIAIARMFNAVGAEYQVFAIEDAVECVRVVIVRGY